jgi:hypothetical protein
MHFHVGWLGPTQGFGHGGYYTGDGCYGYVGHQQDRRASGQENQIVQNTKPDHSVSPKAATAPGHRHEQEAPKDRSSADQLGSSHERTGPGSKSSTNGKAKPDARKSQEEVATEQDRVPEVKEEIRIEARASS